MKQDFGATMMGFCIGVAATAFILGTTVRESGGVAPIQILQENVSADIPMVQPLIPMNINLKILSDNEFNKVKPTTNAGAFTIVGDGNRKCEITIPASMGNIIFNPIDVHSPRFEDKYGVKEWGGETLVHEILHCIIGRWHY